MAANFDLGGCSGATVVLKLVTEVCEKEAYFDPEIENQNRLIFTYSTRLEDEKLKRNRGSETNRSFIKDHSSFDQLERGKVLREAERFPHLPLVEALASLA